MQTGVPTWWESAVKFLEKDDVIGHLVSQYKGESLVGQGDIFSTLVRSIVGQQISVLAADSWWGGGRNPPEALSTAYCFVCDEVRSVKPSCIFHFWCLKQVKNINLGVVHKNVRKI